LETRAGELIKLPEDELKALGAEGKEKKEEIEAAEIKDIHKKHFVD
jgi:hypothetical protein